MPEYPDPESKNQLAESCARCSALVDCRERISWGNGATDADIVIVGEAPGRGDPDADRWKGGNWTGMAYTARHSGRKIRTLFEELGYGPDDCYFTNAVKCFPEGENGSNREPTAEELRNCRTHLETEIRQVDPSVVVTTGKHATESLLAPEAVELDGFVDEILRPILCERLDVTVVPILHPSYQNIWLSRLGYERDVYVDELGALVEADC